MPYGAQWGTRIGKNVTQTKMSDEATWRGI